MIWEKEARRISTAPMLDWTDRHFRYLLRLISRRVWLYTEMIACPALIHGDRARLLQFDPVEHPVAVQLGGSDPRELAGCARLGADAGYDEINLNVGCPSDRVQSGRFGACLMAEPNLVAECVRAMTAVTNLPVSVKTRLGIDDQDSYAELGHFIRTVADAGCRLFIIHARKAWLNGFTPRENREKPPLRYDVVYRLKQDFPELTIHLNGGINTIAQIHTHLAGVDGVMIGREVYRNPFFLAPIDRDFFGDDKPTLTRREIVEAFLPYVERELVAGVKLKHITRHLSGLFYRQPGGRLWRRYLSENAHRENAGTEVLLQALHLIRP